MSAIPAMKVIWRSPDIVHQCCNANSASGALNKWMKQAIGKEYVVHSLRHSIRDRLRAKEYPSDLIDQIGGWTTAGAGEGYGSGYQLEVKAKWLRRLE